MSEYFIMQPIISTDYISINALPEIQKGCMNSEFQFLDKKLTKIEVSLDGGGEFPDFLMADQYAPYISDKLKRVYDRLGIDNLFFQKTIFSLQEFDVEAVYWLAVPPRIHCLDPKCINTELGIATEFHLLKEKVGNYKIFKLSNVGNNELFVTKDLKNELEGLLNSGELEGFKFKTI